MTLVLTSPSPLRVRQTEDEELTTRIRLFLGTLKLAALRHVHVQARDGKVTLKGVVRSFYDRQLAIGCVRRVAGVRQVIDMIKVNEDSATPFTQRSELVEVLP
jgi:osmotically-inducible protein OsmY